MGIENHSSRSEMHDYGHLLNVAKGKNVLSKHEAVLNHNVTTNKVSLETSQVYLRRNLHHEHRVDLDPTTRSIRSGH